VKATRLSEAEEEARNDFFMAMDCAQDLIQEMVESDINMGAALGGILTQTLTALMSVAPNKETAMKVLSSCIHNASFTSLETSEHEQTHQGSDEIH